MFLKTYTELPVDFQRVLDAMREQPTEWLQEIASHLSYSRRRMLVEVGLGVQGHPLSRTARLEVGQPVASEHVASLPLRLEFDEHEGLLPSFTGSLDAAWLGEGRTHLALSAGYEPPLGILGRLADRALLHRVAEIVAHDLLGRIAEELTARVATAGGQRGINHAAATGLR